MRITPKSIGTVRGSNRVPNMSPSAPLMMQASGIRVSRTGQLTSRCTGVAGTTVAIGNTISPANRHCRRAGHDLLEGDQLHRQRREHAVLDLAGVAELLHQRERHGLDALEEDGGGDHAGDEHVENCAAAASLPPTPWPIFGKT